MSELAPSMLMSLSDVAHELSFSVKTVRRMVDRGAIPGVIRIGRAIRVQRDKFVAWTKNGCPKRKR